MRFALAILVAFALLILACSYTLVSVSRSSSSGCLRDQRTIIALRTIIERSSVSVKELHDRGQLNDELYARSREQNRLALRSLQVPDC